MSLIKLFIISSILLVYVTPNVMCIRFSQKCMLSLWEYNPQLAEQLTNLSLTTLYRKWLA